MRLSGYVRYWRTFAPSRRPLQNGKVPPCPDLPVCPREGQGWVMGVNSAGGDRASA
ncbi:hypothetical protein BQ8794_130266 [Mesorhizobium prunaredense]|uniref:Uncharacterized protein n=1 Tax=Mesorhizobium prunaredense TaxID=1631249 RepID=A0A1R3V1J9_9HYPH|nr:hypothetical protein BQ8794_130266 [Mesorhizobium prunaredense]